MLLKYTLLKISRKSSNEPNVPFENFQQFSKGPNVVNFFVFGIS